MPLRVKIDLVGDYGFDRRITEFFISREDELSSRENTHRYTVSNVIYPWNPLADFEHKYSDGAEICVSKALETLQATMTPETLELIHQSTKPRLPQWD